MHARVHARTLDMMDTMVDIVMDMIGLTYLTWLG